MESSRKPAKDLIKPDRPRAMVFAIVSEPAEKFREIETVRKHHMAYLTELDRNGLLIAAGPTLDSTGEYYEGAGLIIVRGDSVAAARSLADDDPFHQMKVRDYSLKPWLLSEGKMFLDECDGTTVHVSIQTDR